MAHTALRLRIGVISIALAGGAASARQVPVSQFVNFETPPVHGVDMTPDGTRLLVVNTPDQRIEVFSLTGALPVWVGSIPVGLEPTSVRARTNAEAWVVNNLSDTVSIVNLTTMNVQATLSVGDEPFDLVFAGAPSRAYVSLSRPNQIKVYDPANLGAAGVTVPVVGARPRAMATDGTRVFALFFESGNRTTIAPQAVVSDPSSPFAGVNPPPNSGTIPETFVPPLAPGLPSPPAGSLVMNKEGTNWKDSGLVIWSPSLITWGLAEHHVAIINTVGLGVTYANTINNINTTIAVQPTTGRVALVGTHLTNYIRFESATAVQFPHHFYVSFDPLSPPTPTAGNGSTLADINPHLLQVPFNGKYITSATPQQVSMSIGDPRALVFKPDGGTMYVAGMGSDNVGRFTVSPVARAATISVGHGACSLAYDAARARVYVLNRFDGTISTIDANTDAVLGTAGFFDPTPAVIKTGRPMLYDSHQFSRLGQASCASCHVDARNDAQAWDLGDPSGAMKPFDAVCSDPTGLGGVCNDWHPVKGPMMTQSLVGIIGDEPLHWRGDRLTLSQFTVGFTGLLGMAAPPSPAQMNQMQQFLATIRRQPNPNRTITDGLPASVPGFPGASPVSGAALFTTPGTFKGVLSCVQCHANADGSSAVVIPGSAIDESQGINVPALREVYTKTGFSLASTQSIRGFGFTHDASADTVFNYLKRPKFTLSAGAAGDQQRRDLEAFLMCFPTGTHPAVGVQVTFTGANNNDPNAVALLGTLQSLADSGSIGLIAKGRVSGMARGYAYVPGTGAMQSDLAAQTITASALRGLGTSGGEITFTGVPIGMQTRQGIDRDADGYFDRDEIVAGSDPNDAASVPACVGDLNHDGQVNTADLTTLLGLFGQSVPPGTPADIDHNGVVNTADLTALLGRFGQGC